MFSRVVWLFFTSGCGIYKDCSVSVWSRRGGEMRFWRVLGDEQKVTTCDQFFFMNSCRFHSMHTFTFTCGFIVSWLSSRYTWAILRGLKKDLQKPIRYYTLVRPYKSFIKWVLSLNANENEMKIGVRLQLGLTDVPLAVEEEMKTKTWSSEAFCLL